MNIIVKTLKPDPKNWEGIPFVLHVKDGRDMPLKAGYYYGKYEAKAGKLLSYKIYQGTEKDFHQWEWLSPTFCREKQKKIVAHYESYYTCDYSGDADTSCYKCREKACQWYAKITETEGLSYLVIQSLFKKMRFI